MPVLHLLAGPNGSGKSTFVEKILQKRTNLPFVNADEIAKNNWPGEESEHAYEASQAAGVVRDLMISSRTSFITETVFSHPSKNELVRQARTAGYLVHLHVMMVPVGVSVKRVEFRVDHGGHDVPEDKIRERHARLWALVAEAVVDADRAVFYDNSRPHRPFRPVATFERGHVVGEPVWPNWADASLVSL